MLHSTVRERRGGGVVGAVQFHRQTANTARVLGDDDGDGDRDRRHGEDASSSGSLSSSPATTTMLTSMLTCALNTDGLMCCTGSRRPRWFDSFGGLPDHVWDGFPRCVLGHGGGSSQYAVPAVLWTLQCTMHVHCTVHTAPYIQTLLSSASADRTAGHLC